MKKPWKRTKRERRNIIHPEGLSRELLAHRAGKPRPAGAVTSGEMAEDILAFIMERYAGRHLDVETAQLALSTVGHQMIMSHLRMVAAQSQN